MYQLHFVWYHCWAVAAGTQWPKRQSGAIWPGYLGLVSQIGAVLIGIAGFGTPLEGVQSGCPTNSGCGKTTNLLT